MKYFIVTLFIFSLLSCGNSSEIGKDFNCRVEYNTDLKKYVGFRKNFTIQLPSHWKTNYYYDEVISSIYTADTTLSLTQTTLIDVSHILNPIAIDSTFINKIKLDNERMSLKEVVSKQVSFLDKPSYYNLSKGKKGKYDYQILNIFSKTDLGFLHIKTEVYGDSLIDKRFCKAINLIEKIEIH